MQILIIAPRMVIGHINTTQNVKSIQCHKNKQFYSTKIYIKFLLGPQPAIPLLWEPWAASRHYRRTRVFYK